MMRHPTSRECVRYVASAYSFLLPFNVTATGNEYADLIASHYDMKNPAIACDVWYARNGIKTITHRMGITEWTEGK